MTKYKRMRLAGKISDNRSLPLSPAIRPLEAAQPEAFG